MNDPGPEALAEAPTPALQPFRSSRFTLDWSRQDIEQRLGFHGGRYTTVNRLLSFIIGLVLTAIFYAAILLGLRHIPDTERYVAMFVERGVSTYLIMLLFFWGLAIQFLKSRKLAFQAKALELSVIPQLPDFFLTPANARSVLDRLHTLVDSPAHFVLFNRLERALSNLNNIGQISDVSNILVIQAEHDDAQVASSYGLLNGFIWATPVLGFIGTVIGLSKAIAGFGLTLQASGDLSGIKQSLQAVTAGLSTAFENTLVALVAALIIHMRTTFLQTRESSFLDACSDYCHKNIAARLRLKTE